MRESGSRCGALHRITLAFIASGLCAYGYGQEQDPFIGAWKLVAARANQSHWEDARVASQGLEPGLVEIESAFGWHLQGPIERALVAHDSRALARELTTAACGALVWKLEASRRAGLSDYYVGKYRVEAARTLYAELLAPAVRHQDVTAHTRVHERIWNAMAAAQAALGRPGFLGRGVVPADSQAYTAAELEIEDALRAAFPFVPEVKR